MKLSRGSYFAIHAVFAAAIFTLSILSAAAQTQRTVPVRAVEHPEYSRLVVPVSAGTIFDLNQQGSSAELSLAGPGPTLSTASVFERMPRTRLLAAVATAPDAEGVRRLRLTLGCSCRVTAERLGSTYIALDIRRVSGAQASETGAAIQSELDVARDLPPESADRVMAGKKMLNPDSDGALEAMESAEAGDLPGGRIVQSLRTLPQIGDGLPDAVGQTDPAELELQADTDVIPTRETQQEDLLTTARNSLIRELSRAADEGILSIAPSAETELSAVLAETEDSVVDTVPSVPDEAEPPKRPTLRAELDAPALPPPDAALNAGLLPHLTVRGPSTSYPNLLTAEDTAPRPICIGDAELDVRQWSVHEGSFADRVSELRRELIDESGSVDAGAVKRLARHYIANGFGRESAVILRTMGAEVSNSAILVDLAELVEGRPAPEDGPVSSSAAENCIGRVTLWRAAGGMFNVDLNSSAGAEIFHALEELPPRLRRQLGKSIARHALQSGSPETAREIIGILDRTPGWPDGDEIRVRAELALAENAPDAAITLVRLDAVERASPNPQSLSIYARAVLAGGYGNKADLSATLEAAAAPFPETADIGLELRLLKARVDARAGAPLDALSDLRDLADAEDARVPEITAAARRILTDFDPLRHEPEIAARVIMENQGFLGVDSESAVLRFTYASALLDSGLPQRALQVVEVPDQLPTADMRVLAGTAHLQLGAPEKALLVLELVAGETAARLKAEAHVRRGDFSAGFEALESLGPKDPERQRLAILSRRWDALGEPEEPGVYDALARYALSEGEDAGSGSDAGPSAMTRDIAEAALDGARDLQLTLDALPVSSSAP